MATARLPQVRAFRAGAALAQTLPAGVGIPLSRLAGRTASYAMPAKRRMIARHLRRASSGRLRGLALRRAVDQAFDSYGRYWYELLSLPVDVRAGRIEDRITVDGYHHIEAGLTRGRGVIVGVPHLGGWEYAGAWIAARGHRPLAVAENVEPPELFEWFKQARAEIGIDIVGLGPHVTSHVIAGLGDNRVVTLVCDRDITGDGVEVNFFGERTTLPAGPALLAFRTGATLLPAAVYFRRGASHRAVICPPLTVERHGKLRDDVARVTQMLVHELEALIERAPDQWHLLQPNWPSDRALG